MIPYSLLRDLIPFFKWSRLSKHSELLFGFFFFPLINGFLWPLSTMSSFRHILAAGSYPHSSPEGTLSTRWHTRITYWESEASAPIMLLFVLWGRCTAMLVKTCWKNMLSQAHSFWHIQFKGINILLILYELSKSEGLFRSIIRDKGRVVGKPFFEVSMGCDCTSI